VGSRCPALIIQGGADATVPVRSAQRIASAMRAAGNSDVTVRIFPGVSHSFLPDPGGLSAGWAALPAFLTTPDLLDELTRWSVGKLRQCMAIARLGVVPRSGARRLLPTSRLPVTYPHVPVWITSSWPTSCPEPWSSFPRSPFLESFRSGDPPPE
jgi:Dienelactone hydrolase family